MITIDGLKEFLNILSNLLWLWYFYNEYKQSKKPPIWGAFLFVKLDSERKWKLSNQKYVFIIAYCSSKGGKLLTSGIALINKRTQVN